MTTLFPNYSTGTVTIATNGTTVTGAGTIWSGVNVRPGDTLQVGNFQTIITDVTDENHLVIPPWGGGAQAGANYVIWKNSPQRFAGAQAMDDVSSAVAAWRSLGYFVFVDPALSAPDPSIGEENQYAFQPTTRKYWLKTGGAWVFQGQPGIGDVVAANHLTDVTLTAPGGVARTAADIILDIGNVENYGAKGDNATDDTAAIQAAVNAVIGAGGGTVRLPRGKYKISSAIVATAPVMFVGGGRDATVIRQTNASANGVVFAYPSLILGGGISDLTIEAGAGFQAGSFTGTGSNGIGLLVQNANNLFFSSSIAVNNFSTGIALDGCWYARFYDFQVLCASADGFRIGGDPSIAVAGGNTLVGGKISNVGFTGVNTNSNGIRIRKSGGEFLQCVDSNGQSTGVLIDPSAGDHVAYLFATNVLADTNVNNGWYIDGNAGLVVGINLTECWGAFSTNATGFVITGSNVDGVELIGCRARENGVSGIIVANTPRNVHILGGEVAQNSQVTSNTSPGIDVGANCNIQIVGVRSGNFASVLSNTQAEGIKLGSGVTGQIIGCNLSNAGAGKNAVANGSNSGDLILIGNRPIQALANRSASAVFSGCNTAAVATNTPTYLGANAANGSVNQTAWSVGRAGVITAFSIAVDVAPGASQSFGYELWKNGASTGMTGSISGSGSFSVSVQAPAVNVNPLDSFAIKLITSNGAAAANHRYNVYLDA
ncbi:Pectate lyase superfamily protein [Bradyrhizobium brasilense]|uniref:Pectate lyase superfamily protein n=1 Tax=Bradyrhizobium brasilense TaxID=1419277 RepID=A0A1G6I7F8_9BRAD|nr:glycosyl hydrolase family 28-related protein [Bradyrhizobium brasilense]SDC02444.1 Pectate lyase superfamily protein [Bradyrhizobium brasilense]